MKAVFKLCVMCVVTLKLDPKQEGVEQIKQLSEELLYTSSGGPLRTQTIDDWEVNWARDSLQL